MPQGGALFECRLVHFLNAGSTCHPQPAAASQPTTSAAFANLFIFLICPFPFHVDG